MRLSCHVTPPSAKWHAASVQLTGFAEVDQRRLRFDPFRSGRGIEPVGFVHNLRRAAYWTSQRARPSRSR